MFSDPCFLCGDVGGTNSRFVLYVVRGGIVILQYKNVYPSRSRPFVGIVRQFLEEAASLARQEMGGNVEDAGEGKFVPLAACVAIAGPVFKNTCHVTNLAWDLNGEQLGKELGIRRFEMVNDFQAQGYGLLGLGEEDRIKLNNAEGSEGTPKCCLGAGTGMGQCYLTAEASGQYLVFPCEGGHVDFAPRNAIEFGLLDFILERERVDRVSVERVVSGMGIPLIYHYLASKSPNLVDSEVAKEISIQDPGATIARFASKGDALCVQTLELFIACYGSEAGNWALKTLATGGVYVSGGIGPRFLTIKHYQDIFMTNYLGKGRMRALLENMPVYLVTHPDVGLLGAQVVALRLLDEMRVPIKERRVSINVVNCLCTDGHHNHEESAPELVTLAPHKSTQYEELELKTSVQPITSWLGLHPAVEYLIFIALLISGYGAYAFDVNQSASAISATVFWTLLYSALCLFFVNVLPDGREPLEGFATGLYYVSSIHQVLAMIFLLSLALVPNHPSNYTAWFYGGWKDSQFFERQIFYSCFGYALKDFIVAEVDFGFFLHHLFTIIGAVLCLKSPLGVGIITLNGVVAEVGSNFYSLNTLFKDRIRIAYFIIMNASNIFAAYLSYLYCSQPIPLIFSGTYGFLTVGLLIFRTMGAFTTIAKPYKKVKQL